MGEKGGRVIVSIETLIYILVILAGLIGSGFIARNDFRRYGLLYVISGTAAVLICFFFVSVVSYAFPFRLFGRISSTPFESVFLAIPFLVLLGVRYSPVYWLYKIPFYWGIVHLATLTETLILEKSMVIRYQNWNTLDSYILWWIYLLAFEWIGGRIVPTRSRKPIGSEAFRYGGWAWLLFHAIVISTFFLGGYYFGRIGLGR